MSTDPSRHNHQRPAHREGEVTRADSIAKPAVPPQVKPQSGALPGANKNSLAGDLQNASGAAPKKLSPIDAAAQAFRAAGQAKVEPPGGPSHFTLLRSRIQEGIAKNLSKDDILEDLVTFETTRAFGKDATEEVRKKVADQFREDPRLASLFGELFTASRYTL